MLNFAHGEIEAESDSLELWIFTIGALAIGLLLGYMLAGNNTKKPSKPEAPAKKPAKK